MRKMASSNSGKAASGTEQLQRQLLDDKRVKALVQRKPVAGRSGSGGGGGGAYEWRCFALGAAFMACFVLAALALLFCIAVSWHAAGDAHDPGLALPPLPLGLRPRDAAAAARSARSLPVSTLWREDLDRDRSCPWQSASRWLESLQQDDDVWARLRDRCLSTFQGLSLEACADLPRGLDCSRAVEDSFWRFALAHVPGSGNRGRYADQVVVAKLSSALGMPAPRVVLVPDDCDASTLFSRKELRHMLDNHASFCEVCADAVMKRAAAVVRADPCRAARFENLVLPEVRREDAEHSTLYLPSLLFAPSLFQDPAVDMARAYAAGPVLVAAALAAAAGARDPDLAAVNATRLVLRHHLPSSAVASCPTCAMPWEAEFVRRAAWFLDCRDSELRGQAPPPDRAERLARALLPAPPPPSRVVNDDNSTWTLSDA